MPYTFIPDKKAVERIVKSIFKFLFPETNAYSELKFKNDPGELKKELRNILSGLTTTKARVVSLFFNDLENIKITLYKDAKFILDSDPAANELIEVVSIYPGFFALFCYRIAHSLSLLSIPLIPRMITEYAHKETGIDIHPKASIGCPVSIDHGTGIVIGETVSIGNSVKLYQGVTLGALSVEKKMSSEKRHPTIEDNVILYAGCTILGGDTVIGRNTIIGGNVWLTESLPPYSVAFHKSEVIVRNQKDIREPLNFII
jgi:serine O-acetyltransferase